MSGSRVSRDRLAEWIEWRARAVQSWLWALSCHATAAPPARSGDGTSPSPDRDLFRSPSLRVNTSEKCQHRTWWELLDQLVGTVAAGARTGHGIVRRTCSPG